MNNPLEDSHGDSKQSSESSEKRKETEYVDGAVYQFTANNSLVQDYDF